MTREHMDFLLKGKLIKEGKVLNRGEWQSVTGKPQDRVLEIHNVNMDFPVYPRREKWAEAIKPNLPWAEDHFKERISGSPLNPGDQYKNWPWYEQGVEEHKQTGRFSHTYMERFWPRQANNPDPFEVNFGIRFEYGDYNDLLVLLNKRPLTRQAYLPIWFPEDLNASLKGERVPCSIGYHFLAKPFQGGYEFDCYYTLRSCDFIRYMWDDIYMAGRLLQEVTRQVRHASPGRLFVTINNLHVFADERSRIKSEYETELNRRLTSYI